MFTSQISQFSKAINKFAKVNVEKTLMLRAFVFTRIPLLWWIRPTLVELSEENTIFSIPLDRRTRNHLNSMYFGALAMGGEAAVAVRVVFSARDKKQNISFVFKDFKANFLKRAEADVHFICNQGKEVDALIDLAVSTGQRQEQTFTSYAIVPSKNPDERIAEFVVTLSMKPVTKKR